jgi:hypothetical protein
VFYLHFNRIAMQRNDPKVWSVRTSKGCFHAESVMVNLPLVTIFKPHQKNNPRAFFKGYGYGMWVTDKFNKEHLVLSSQPFGTQPMADSMDFKLMQFLQGTSKPRKRARK